MPTIIYHMDGIDLTVLNSKYSGILRTTATFVGLGMFLNLKLKKTNLGGIRWHFIKKKIGTQIHLDEDLNLGGLGIHPHPQPTELAQLPKSKV